MNAKKNQQRFATIFLSFFITKNHLQLVGGLDWIGLDKQRNEIHSSPHKLTATHTENEILQKRFEKHNFHLKMRLDLKRQKLE